MARILLLAGAAASPRVPGQTPAQAAEEVLPALGLLLHELSTLPAQETALLDAPAVDVVLVDARRELPSARNLCRLLRTSGLRCPVIVVMTEGALTALSSDWGIDDVVLATAGPAEVEARIRLVLSRGQPAPTPKASQQTGPLEISVDSYTASLRGRALDLTFKEFELLRYLAQHPGRVFSRAQLLQEVWGYDYFGGTRTVDVHVRRLRAKLGVENEWLIGTIRNVGYRFETARRDTSPDSPSQPHAFHPNAFHPDASTPDAVKSEQP